MITLLDRYLYRRFGRNLGVILAAFVGIYLLVDFFERIDNFMEKDLPLGLAMRYFWCKVPFMAQQVAPAAVMLAGIVTVGWLQRTGELISLQAAGIRLRRVIRPVVVAGLAASLLVVALLQWVLPATMAATNRIWYQRVNASHPVGFTPQGTSFQRGRQGFYYSFGLPAADGTVRDFVYTEWDAAYGFVRQLAACEARPAGDGWLLIDGMRKTVAEEGSPRVERFQRLEVRLPEKPDDLFVPFFYEDELSLTGLWQEGEDPMRGPDARRRLHEVLSYALLGVPLLLIGLPGLVQINQRWHRDLTIAVPAACTLAFLVWGGWGLLQSLAKSGAFHYIPAAWLPHLLVGGFGFAAIRRL